MSDLTALLDGRMRANDLPARRRTYAGIGSRRIREDEAAILRGLGKRLAELDYWLYSGNAVGADQAFEEGAVARAMLFLPWEGYNESIGRDAVKCTQITDHALRIASELHPKGSKLSPRSLLLMARNVQIIDGIQGYCPPVEFVLCCADPLNDGVVGGAAMAYRVAKLRGIPFINVRQSKWQTDLAELGVLSD